MLINVATTSFLTLFALAMGACQDPAVDENEVHDAEPISVMASDEFVGYVDFGFETSSFTRCGGEARWWVDGAEPAAELNERASEVGGTGNGRGRIVHAFVRLKGETTEPGEFGHLGQYERVLTVTDVLEVRASTDDDCAPG